MWGGGTRIASVAGLKSRGGHERSKCIATVFDTAMTLNIMQSFTMSNKMYHFNVYDYFCKGESGCVCGVCHRLMSPNSVHIDTLHSLQIPYFHSNCAILIVIHWIQLTPSKQAKSLIDTYSIHPNPTSHHTPVR